MAVVYVAAQPTSLDTRAVRYIPFATDPHFEGYFPETFTFSLGLAFSPNGRNLAVLVEPREQAAFETELWIVPTNSDPPRRALDRVPYGFGHARVSGTADNRHVVLGGAIAGRGSMDLYVVDAESGSIHALTSGVTEALSPSCRLVAIVSRSHPGRTRPT